MKIYTNFRHEIKAINFTTDTELTEHEVNREEVFGNYSDFRILNYCYKVTEFGYSVYPATNLDYIDRFDFEDKINNLEARNKELEKQSNELENALVELASLV